MMLWKLNWLSAATQMAAVGVLACGFSHVATAGFLPPNDLDKEDNIFEFNPNVSEDQFKDVIARAQEVYGPIIQEFGATLTIDGRWTDATVNASASRDAFNPKNWLLTMYGGLARRPEVTVDGFTMVLCHELGHHLGGFPFVRDWAANEGQADYFASLECTRHFWGDDAAGNAAARELIPKFAKERCDEIWTSTDAQDLCYRNMLASKSISDLLAALGGSKVSFETPDDSEVSETYNAHPAAQCRLDTYMAGALCTADFDQDLIPGASKDDRNSPEAEEESSLNTCTRSRQFTQGLRPLCWFKPRL